MLKNKNHGAIITTALHHLNHEINLLKKDWLGKFFPSFFYFRATELTGRCDEQVFQGRRGLTFPAVCFSLILGLLLLDFALWRVVYGLFGQHSPLFFC